MFVGFRPQRYGLRIYTGVAFIIRVGQQNNLHQRSNVCQLDVKSDPSLIILLWIYVWPSNISTFIRACAQSALGKLGDTFQKCVMKFTVPEATNTRQDDHICAGLKSVISVTVHGVQDILDANSSTENWGFLLVDKKKLSTRSIP